NEHKNIYIELDSLNGAYNNDLVLAKRVFNPRSKTKAKIIKVLEGSKNQLIVYVKDKSYITLKENIVLENKIDSSCKDDDVLVLENPSLKIVSKVGNLSDPKIDEYISLFLYHEEFRLEMPIKVDAKMDDKKDRVDLTHLPFCTIDPSSAKDHDDAIYYDDSEKVLYVAIADVSYFVKEGSDLDKIAFKKSTSAYLPGKVLPMLPNELSEDMCSLKEGVDRYSYVFKMYIDTNNLTVKKSQLFEAIINSHRKFSYGRIDRVIENKLDKYTEIEKKIFDYLIPLYEVTKNFRAKRMKKGYDFRSVENRLVLKNQVLQNIDVEESTGSHQLIEECMLLANIEASKKVNEVGIYRIHEEPPFKAISQLVDDVNMLGIKVKLKNDIHETISHIQNRAKNTYLQDDVDELIIHSQTQAKYSSKNFGHFGLGFNSYSHFTSPIRRYSDLVLHRILKSRKTPENIDEICEYISTNERKIDQLVWDFEDRKYARWAKDNIGAELKVKIVDTDRSKAVCYEKLNGLKVNIDNYKGQALYSRIKVVIKDANIANKQIVASIKY
ncbi:MAG: ribonuclease R family protein, partial [Sulfurovum sp.]